MSGDPRARCGGAVTPTLGVVLERSPLRAACGLGWTPALTGRARLRARCCAAPCTGTTNRTTVSGECPWGDWPTRGRRAAGGCPTCRSAAARGVCAAAGGAARARGRARAARPGGLRRACGAGRASVCWPGRCATGGWWAAVPRITRFGSAWEPGTMVDLAGAPVPAPPPGPPPGSCAGRSASCAGRSPRPLRSWTAGRRPVARGRSPAAGRDPRGNPRARPAAGGSRPRALAVLGLAARVRRDRRSGSRATTARPSAVGRPSAAPARCVSWTPSRAGRWWPR